MKVAHINCLLTKHGMTGVEKKLDQQAKAVSRLGLNMDVFYMDFTRRVQSRRVIFCERPQGTLQNITHTLSRYAPVPHYVNTDQYDLLVLRYSGGDFSLLSKFFRINAKKIVTEHHTKELDEALTYNTTWPQKILTLCMERFLGPAMIKKCAGLIANCDEVKEYELKRAGTPIPACTVTDGVSVSDVRFSQHAAYDGQILNLLCIADSFEAWQGLDRILVGLQQYASRRPLLILTVVGGVPEHHIHLAGRLKDQSNVGVQLLGKLYGRKLERVFEGTHIAFSPLAMFRKGLRGGCALKTREYLARGLPFVIGHDDPDLGDAEDFFFSVPADESPLNMDEVVTFAENVLSRPDVSDVMRKFAYRNVDWEIKIQQTWDFLESVWRGNGAKRR